MLHLLPLFSFVPVIFLAFFVIYCGGLMVILYGCQIPANLMSKKEIHDLAGAPWQPKTAPSTVNWLQPSLGDGDAERLEAMGNIVQPQLANLAAHMLSQS